MRWFGPPMEDGLGHHDDDGVPMEVDRIGGNSWKKGKGGKGKNNCDGENSYPGGKTKSKGKDSGKLFQKGSTSKQQNEPKRKGKSDKSDQQCFRCGATGHFAKDCWAKIRNVQNGHQMEGITSLAPGSNQPQAQQNASPSPTQSTEYRVSHTSSYFSNPGRDAGPQRMVFEFASGCYVSITCRFSLCSAAVLHW